MDILFQTILLVIAIYVIYAAIRGKGRLFQAEFIKEQFQDKYIKVLRILYLSLGGLMVLQVLAASGTNLLYDAKYTFHFTAPYEDANGVKYEVDGREYTEDEMLAILATPVPSGEDGDSVQATAAPAPQGGSLCDPYGGAPTQPVVGTPGYSIKEKAGKWAFLTPTLLNVLSYVFLGAALLALIGVFVAINIMTDKVKRREAQAEIRREGDTLPKAAFEFDEN